MNTEIVYHGDCIQGMRELPAESVDLVFADPPFNIGYDYDVYDDRKTEHSYYKWCRAWAREIHRVLKPHGSFWCAIGDEYAAELKLIFHHVLGFSFRNWVIWYYTFGVNCKKKFARSHTHLLYFTKHKSKFTFNDSAIRVPSARQLVYNDTRAADGGKVPDNTWILRPQDCEDDWTPDQDTWHVPRVCGTFKERSGFHGCQMPERVMQRIILTFSNEGDVVLDPFAGSGTTLAVAQRLKRRWIGFEISKDYCDGIVRRLNHDEEQPQ